MQALILEDDESSRTALVRILEKSGFETLTAGTLKVARALLRDRNPDLLLLDFDLPDGNGFELVDQLQSGTDPEIIVVTAHGSVGSAVHSLRCGVCDYLEKPVDLLSLNRAISRARRAIELQSEVKELRAELRGLGKYAGIVGSSQAMQELFDQLAQVAPTETTVLLIGETGVGKEVVARGLHQLSRRSHQPFEALNCGVIQPTLIESELFGHERGSFTGAERRHRGIFERAGAGTLFLDEITEMPAELQVKLLRVLEARTFRRVGGDGDLFLEARLLSATNREPREAVADGSLREDLYYRLNVFPLRIPPLRERTDDIALLAMHFLGQFKDETEIDKEFSPEALEALQEQDWPGNVRQLRNTVERGFILASRVITPNHLGLNSTAPAGTPAATTERVTLTVGTSIAEAERLLLLATLEKYGGNKQRTAATLGISLKTLYSRLHKYGKMSKTP